MNVKFDVAIFDFDNTLYDWVDQWYHGFKPFLDELIRISGLPETDLKSAIRAVHQKHRTSEYAFLVESLNIIRDGTVQDTVHKYSPAVAARRSGRRAYLKLYPGVLETLVAMRDAGVFLVIFTESQTFYTTMRMKRLGLDGVINVLYSTDDHDLPDKSYVNQLRSYPSSYYKLSETKQKSLGVKTKPNPRILLSIISDLKVEAANTIYVGDSMFKDVAMANQAGVFSAWAAYGEAKGHPGYDLLREVSHWTDEDIQREIDLRKADAVPDVTLVSGLPELIESVNGRGLRK